MKGSKIKTISKKYMKKKNSKKGLEKHWGCLEIL